jgi:L-threonylcarbamoyladenylate synthase
MGGLGVAAPSANRFGAVSPTSADAVRIEIERYLSNSDLILDGGQCIIGIESTIINCTKSQPTILRPGGVTIEEVQEALGMKITSNDIPALGNNIKTSGLQNSHYAPHAKVFITGSPMPGDGFIALESIPTPKGVIRLANPKNNEEYAQILYRALSLADSKGLEKIFVIPPTGTGLAVAINDRLGKAAFQG